LAGLKAGVVVGCGHSDSTPPGTTCECQRLTARIVPSSLRSEPLRGQQTLHLRFTLHWLLSCSTGNGACVCEIAAKTPKRAWNAAKGDLGYLVSLMRADDKLPSGKVACRAKCRETVDGGVAFELRTVSRGLDPIHRADESLPLVYGRKCQGKTAAPIRLSLHFDEAGKLDVKRSRLG
jgi:hypothetical protein